MTMPKSLLAFALPLCLATPALAAEPVAPPATATDAKAEKEPAKKKKGPPKKAGDDGKNEPKKGDAK